MTEARNRQRASFQLLLVTLWITLLVLAVTVWAGWAMRSLSLLAESLHTLIDSFSIVLGLLTVISSRRFSQRDIWSYSKRESLALLVFVAFLGFCGFSIFNTALAQLQAAIDRQPLPFSTEVGMPLIQLLGLVVAIDICLMLFERYEARVLESPVLLLNANHMLRDVWLTIVVLVGLIGVAQGYVWLDSVMAIALVGLAASSFWRVLNWQLPLFIQQMAIAPEALAQIACQVDGVTHCYPSRAQGLVGRYVLVELHLTVHPEFVSLGQMIAERVEFALREQYGSLQAIIHINGDVSYRPVRSSHVAGMPKLKRDRIRPDLN